MWGEHALVSPLLKLVYVWVSRRVAAAIFSHIAHTWAATRPSALPPVRHTQRPTLNFHSTDSRIHVTGINNKIKRFLSMAMGERERASSLVTRAFKVNYGDDVRIKSIRTAHTMRIRNAKLHFLFVSRFEFSLRWTSVCSYWQLSRIHSRPQYSSEIKSETEFFSRISIT